ncbi:MAG: 2-hydroxychromene-2-carboxylate isomerase [Alphaproteobacteria bacterium]|nr:2-hydroxychromene-2-carboxylate isomerase [Alphaproteobacteria bacterium]
MQRTIEFYFDFISPFTYLAYHRLPNLAARYGYTLDYRVADLAELRRLAGNTGPRQTEQPLKLPYSRTDQRRWAERYGIPIKPPVGSHDSSWLNRGSFYALDRGQIKAYLDAAWAKMRRDGRDIAEEGFRREVATDLGWAPEEFLAYTKSDESQARYRAATQRAHERGVFGVPTMLIGDEMWWGNDRLDFLEEFLQAETADQRRAAS